MASQSQMRASGHEPENHTESGERLKRKNGLNKPARTPVRTFLRLKPLVLSVFEVFDDGFLPGWSSPDTEVKVLVKVLTRFSL